MKYCSVECKQKGTSLNKSFETKCEQCGILIRVQNNKTKTSNHFFVLKNAVLNIKKEDI